jgi:primosomal protein N' (replication factor Y)
MAVQIEEWIGEEKRKNTSIIGPVPCFFSKIDGIYRWQIILRGPEPETLLRGKELRGWRVEVGPISLL